MEKDAFQFDRALVLTITALLFNAKEAEEALDDPPETPPELVQMPINFVLMNILQSRQNAYSTTIAQDTALLENSTVQGRHRMAIAVRLGEKEILAMAADEIKRRIARIGVPAREWQETNQVKRRKI